MRRQVHLVIGAIAYFVYTFPLYLLLRLPGDLMLAGLFAALLGSVLPDALEPARTWSHRGFGHSRRAMRFSLWAFALTGVLGLLRSFVPGLSPSYILSCFFLGYALHLLADSTTPAGIPG